MDRPLVQWSKQSSSLSDVMLFPKVSSYTGSTRVCSSRACSNRSLTPGKSLAAPKYLERERERERERWNCKLSTPTNTVSHLYPLFPGRDFPSWSNIFGPVFCDTSAIIKCNPPLFTHYLYSLSPSFSPSLPPISLMITTHYIVGSPELHDAFLPVSLFSQEFVDLIVQISDPELTKTSW